MVAFVVQDSHSLSTEKLLEQMSESLDRIIPSITDRYSLLRYYLFLIQKQKLSVSIDDLMPRTINDIGDAGIHLAHNHSFLNQDGDVLELLENSRNLVDYFLALVSIIYKKKPISMSKILNQQNESPYIDSLFSHIFNSVMSEDNEQELTDLLRYQLDNTSSGSDRLKLLLDLAAENRLNILSIKEIIQYLNIRKVGVSNFCALLRFIGENNQTALIDSLYELTKQTSIDTSVLYTLIDVIAQIGNEGSIEVLQRVPTGQSKTLEDFVKISIEELEETEGRTQKEGITLVQCAFYGDLTRPGVSGGGGLNTFLFELGNQLEKGELIDTVYTFSLLPVDESNTEPLVRKLGHNHTLIRIPISFQIRDESIDFLQNEFEIIRAVRRTIERYRINPDIFHVRYTDNASKAVAKLAKEMGRKVVFTLTPDPHATFVGNDGNYRPMTEERLLRNLNKTLVADILVDSVDGILLIGYEEKNTQVLPYFPQLLLDNHLREKPLRIVAEGVCSELCQIEEIDEIDYKDLLTAHRGKYHIAPSFVSRPIIVNVGRLHPLKGQHLLVRAWAESSLNQIYNLVIIGGDLENPSPIELSIIEQIDEVMMENPKLTGKFSHIPALPNRTVRDLECSIVDNILSPFPNVYLCSSYKEEFGISILEGLVAGLMVLAPQRGGVSDYLRNGINGFLIATDDAESIRRDSENILQTDEYKGHFSEIALRGQRFAREQLSIRRIATDYSEYYKELLQKK